VIALYPKDLADLPRLLKKLGIDASHDRSHEADIEEPEGDL
jgi:hypothetical protein